MKNLKPTNRYRKVLIENIVFLQGQDYDEYDEEKNKWYEVEASWSDIEYLLQWYYSNENHLSDVYSVRDINTPFLGKLIKIDNYPGYFLFTKNTHVGYIGLSRVVEFSPKVID